MSIFGKAYKKKYPDYTGMDSEHKALANLRLIKQQDDKVKQLKKQQEDRVKNRVTKRAKFQKIIDAGKRK